MKTFLETHKERSRSFLLYGNLNDTVWCSDLVIRSSEQYLVKYLKSRGYKHIIFYGDAATKGAYCLDPESARFFFNPGIPLPAGQDPSEPEENGGNEPDGSVQDGSTLSGNMRDGGGLSGGTAGNRAACPASSKRINLAAMTGRRRTTGAHTTSGYRPGDFSRGQDDISSSNNSQGGGSPIVQTPVTAAESTTSVEDGVAENRTTETAGAAETPQTVRYSRRELTLENFLNLIQRPMLDPDSQMAVVFYNVFTSDLGRAQTLRDNVLNIWEQVRDEDGVYNLCLFLAPESAGSTAALIHQIQSLGLAPKFLRTDANGQQILNPDICLPFGQPQEDEIRSLLRRFRIVGVGTRHRKITFRYQDLDDIIAEILYCSRSCQGGKPPEYMRGIHSRIQSYVEAQPSLGKVEITPDVVDVIWERPSRDREPAMEKLNRPGWEKAVSVVERAVRECQAFSASHTAPARRETPDWTILRFSTESGPAVPRAPVPNFVLVGNPGVGKTTIARLIGDVLREHGILKVGATVEVTRENLTSSYVAGVPKATMDCVNRAEEGVLFIDEAHALGRKDGGANHEGTGKEVVSTLNSAMTDPNRHFSVILAGYADEMREVFKLDDGFARRFGEQNWIHLDDYPPELLRTILENAIQSHRCRMDPALTEEREDEPKPLACYVERVYQERDRKRFGNAGEMQRLALTACAHARDGIVTEQCFYTDKVDHAWFLPSSTSHSLDKILSDIREQFVGMEGIERYFIARAQQIEEILVNGGTEEDVELRPLLLVGNPGTGKTSIAGLLSRLYYHFHLLGTPEAIETSASALASTYSGGTQEKVLEFIRDAQDRKALLFIDEAHQLVTDRFDGPGAVRAFLNPLTDRKHPFMAVFAVYPSALESFLNLDPGNRRRFEILSLEDYTGEQLFHILVKMMERHTPPLRMGEEVSALLRRVCEYLYVSRKEDTGNAGRMERLLKEMNERRRARCTAEGMRPGSPEYACFLPEDVPPELVRELPLEDATVDDLLGELNRLCGLASVKSRITGLVRIAQANQQRQKMGLPFSPVGLHMVFAGNPGTGKTTVARLIGRIFQSIGLLPRGQLVETSRGDLVAGYVGQTAIKTQEVIDSARGGVLFIDEAYTLNAYSSNDFGQEAIDTLLKNMEDRRTEMAVIAAGYTEPMERFLASNPGLRSRFSHKLVFPDYSLEELAEILDSLCAKFQYTLTTEARRLAVEEIRRQMEREGDQFSNGRSVRNLFDRLIFCMAERLGAMGISTAQNVEAMTTITEADVEAATRGV